MFYFKLRVWDLGREVMIPWDEVKYDFNVEDLRDEEFFIPLFYTGLKDAKRMEVYHGDVVEGYQYGQTMTGTVIFKDGGFWWEFDGGTSYLAEVLTKFKGVVVGNIYEN